MILAVPVPSKRYIVDYMYTVSMSSALEWVSLSLPEFIMPGIYAVRAVIEVGIG